MSSTTRPVLVFTLTGLLLAGALALMGRDTVVDQEEELYLALRDE